MSAEAKPVEALGPGDFQARVGQRFTVVWNEGDLALELVSVRELPAHSRRQGQPFVLLFRGPRQPVLPQRIYTLAHGELGQLVIFLVPVEGGPAGIEYEAVFN
jgi:hypothetical protein